MMSLKTDLVKNKETTLIKFNFLSIVIICAVLSLMSWIFISIALGIVFTSISGVYIIFLFITKRSLKKLELTEDEKHT